MELGGNAPFLVFADADLDAAVEGAMLAKMRNMGEACTAANRFLVHESVAEEFAARLAERMGALVVGRGTEDGVDVGPLVDAPRRAQGAASSSRTPSTTGAEVLTGGDAAGERGYFYAPTVLADVRPGAAPAQRGDLRPGRADRDVRAPTPRRLRLANDTEYGLVAYVVHPRPAARAPRHRGPRDRHGRLNQGIVSNPAAPFGGVKQSGFGREGGVEGIEEYLETKYVGIPV